jgi:hypothetical protein
VCVAHAEFPDNGGHWTCTDSDGEVTCTRSIEDGPVPSNGAWECRVADELVTCVDSTPSYPSEGGGQPTDCWFQDEFRVCEFGEGDGSSPGGEIPGDVPGGTIPGGADDGSDDGPSDGPGGDDGGDNPPGTPDDGTPDTPTDTTTPPFSGVCVNYYAAKWDGEGLGGCSSGGTIFCVENPAGFQDGCGMATVSGSGGNVNITLPNNCQLLEAASKCANECADATMSGGNGTFGPCGMHAISHTEAAWCCS